MKAVKKRIPVEAVQTKKPRDIKTIEGTMHANAGDWILKGIDGEQWPVKREIFNKTYDILSGEKCKYCTGKEIELCSYENEAIEDDYVRLLFDSEDCSISITNDMSRLAPSVEIEYCPFCGRKL